MAGFSIALVRPLGSLDIRTPTRKMGALMLVERRKR
jgi:hypothetical protein